MAVTQADVDRLKQAIARGVRSVQQNGETVVYGSMAEMREALRFAENELAGTTTSSRGRARVMYPSTGRGV